MIHSPLALSPGDPVPWFSAASTSSPTYQFSTVGGYRIILSFLGSCQLEPTRQVLQQLASLQQQLADRRIPCFIVTINPDDRGWETLIEHPSFFKFFWDFDREVSSLYGVCRSSADAAAEGEYTPVTIVLNQNLHVAGVFPLDDPTLHVQQVMACAQSIPEFEPPQLAQRQAPVLLIPDVFDREFCQQLIHAYETDGGRDSGFMRQVDGKTVEVFDRGFKRRRDLLLKDSPLLSRVNEAIVRRIKPEIEKVFQFSITRFERHLVACYEAQHEGFFNRHRDNTTKGTAHRRFAMTINLNTGYEGGCLWFPEYGSQLYRPNIGEAVIFSCSLLHEVTPVTHDRRFALLSFFYNDQDAQLRERNLEYVQSPPAISQVAPTQRGFQPAKSNKKRR